MTKRLYVYVREPKWMALLFQLVYILGWRKTFDILYCESCGEWLDCTG